MRLLASSWRIETSHAERWEQLHASKQPYVFLLWHEALLPLLWWHRGQNVAILVSEAREGRYLADFAASLGYRMLWGSSTRGGARALLGAVRELQEGRVIAITPDGPRGPRRQIKPGAILAAQRGGGTILPLHAEAARAWRLHSWDRLMIPKPAARVRITYGCPFQVPAGEAGLADGLIAAEAGLREVTGQWRDAATPIA